jgi:N-sulfoglucosamine sulfohydrolase
MSARPNILWISFEDTNPFYGCYGDSVAHTPNVDKLAAQGCRWPNAFSTAGVCAPARSAIITGMYAISVGTHHMRTTHTQPNAPELPTPYAAVLPPHVKCFTEYLRAAGYYCTNNDKTDYQFDPPLTAWDELSKTAHWRNRPDPQQPFFAVFNLMPSHESGMWEEDSPPLTIDPAAVEVPPHFPDTPKVRQALARMYTRIEQNDKRMAEILKELEDDGLADNTVVVHWSDHGPLPRGKRGPYDSGIHIPMIIRWPGHLDPGSLNMRLVSTVDLGPTMLSIANVPIPAHMQGRAFLGEQAAPPRAFVFATRDRHDSSYDRVRAIRDKRYKYIRNYHPELPYTLWIPYLNRHPIMQELWRLHCANELTGPQKLLFQSQRPIEELYDTQNDPWELDNLAGDEKYHGELIRLRAALDEWLDDVGDMGEISESEMVRRWYPDGKQPRTAAPLFIPVNAENPGIDPSPGSSFRGPVVLQLYCATQGASMAYTLESGERPHWLLYSGPLRLPAGATTVRARAVRIGYAESEERSATFSVT